MTEGTGAMPTNSRKLIRWLKDAGWQPVRQRGSHTFFRHPTRPGRVMVPTPHHGAEEFSGSLLARIRRQAEGARASEPGRRQGC